jgi:magnesium chelatase family protein
VPTVLTHVATFAIYGLEPRRVWVEVDIRAGLPGFTVVGLADKAVREARERVWAALLNSGFEFPQRRITANLAPAYLRKAGPSYDLALAVGILAGSGQLDPEPLTRFAVFGELGLGGELRPCRGVLAVAEGARRSGPPGLLVARSQAAEAALVDGVAIAGVETLREAVEVLGGEREPPPPPPGVEAAAGDDAPAADLADVRGHAVPRRALEIAAAGGHNLLLQGPPGTGKTMLARRLPGILPPLTAPEAIDVTRIRSIAGLHNGGLVSRRPFRAPHHTTSSAGLVGGGPLPMPGEATLAHLGVLFLDELSEFPRPSLEALRQPLEDGYVTVVRSQHVCVFPTRVMLVASTNPCPCGFAGAGDGRCRCSEVELARHRRRLSGPLLDRIDLLVDVQRPTASELGGPERESSAAVRERVVAARVRQRDRLPRGRVTCNGQLDAAQVRQTIDAELAARRTLLDAYDRGRLSARGHHRVMRVARTIADLDEAKTVSRHHVLTALSLRGDDSAEALAA